MRIDTRRASEVLGGKHLAAAEEDDSRGRDAAIDLDAPSGSTAE
jgi:hypothetical protein